MSDNSVRVQHIRLDPPDGECYVCGAHTLLRCAVPVTEGLIVADNDPGEWAGMATCRRCYYLVRGLQAEHPGHRVAVNYVRELVNGGRP